MSMKQFQELLAELNAVEQNATTMAKSLPGAEADADPDADPDAGEGDEGDDDAAIQAAAAEGGDNVLGKSMTVLDADGNEAEAFDATELVKSLMERQEGQSETLAKAMTTMTTVLKSQSELIKSLGAQVAELRAQGRGRRSQLTVAEKPDAGVLAKSAGAEGVTVNEFFAKANAAFDAGALSGKELNTISVCMRERQSIPDDLIAKVVAHKS